MRQGKLRWRGKPLYHYKVVFRGKLRGKAGGIPDYRIVLANNKKDAHKKTKAMFKGDIKIDRITRADKR